VNYHQIQARAALVARAQGITQSAALSQLAKAAAASRQRRCHCRTEITPADKAAFNNVEQPSPRYWWLKEN
jgi:hypothetical protein